MIRRGHLVAIALAVLTSVVVLVRVASDRSDPPEASVWLTEREMPIVPPELESSFLFLRVEVRDAAAGGRAEYDASLLRDVGFDTSFPPERDGSYRHYALEPSRPAWAALEFEGDAWRASDRREHEALAARGLARGLEGDALAQETRALDSRLAAASRLFLVDVAKSPEALRERYPDREHVLVLPVRVRVQVRQEPKTRPRLAAWVLWGPLEVAVPTPLRAEIAGLADDDTRGKPGAAGASAPRYRARLLVGRRFLPRIGAIERLGPPK